MIFNRHGVALLLGLLVFCRCDSVMAQIDPRLTGTAVVAKLEAAQHDLSARAATLPDSSLGATSKRLDDFAGTLRKALADDAAKPVDKLSDKLKALALSAEAAVKFTRAYLSAARDCLPGDASAMAAALAVDINHIGDSADSSKADQPVIEGIETTEHRAVFALHSNSRNVAFALSGANLYDSSCDYPEVTATDDKGKSLSVQPVVTGVLPNRIDLKLPDDAGLVEGVYALHVVTKRKGFLFGCSAKPETVAAIKIVPPVKIAVSYSLTPTCRVHGAAKAMQAIVGMLPDITSDHATVSQQIEKAACNDPVSYTISAKANFASGESAEAGPITQSANASITAGMAGDLLVIWNPSVHTLFLRAGSINCAGIYRPASPKPTAAGEKQQAR